MPVTALIGYFMLVLHVPMYMNMLPPPLTRKCIFEPLISGRPSGPARPSVRITDLRFNIFCKLMCIRLFLMLIHSFIASLLVVLLLIVNDYVRAFIKFRFHALSVARVRNLPRGHQDLQRWPPVA